MRGLSRLVQATRGFSTSVARKSQSWQQKGVPGSVRWLHHLIVLWAVSRCLFNTTCGSATPSNGSLQGQHLPFKSPALCQCNAGFNRPHCSAYRYFVLLVLVAGVSVLRKFPI